MLSLHSRQPSYAVPAAAAATFILLVAVGYWTSGYYQFTRVAVLAAGIVVAREAHLAGRLR